MLGRPGVGKACLLRDMCRLVSSTPAQGGLGLHVMMLDTTADLAGGGQAGGQSFKDVRDVTDYAFHHSVPCYE